MLAVELDQVLSDAAANLMRIVDVGD